MNKKTKITIITIASILVIAIIVGLVVLLSLGDNSSKKGNPANSPISESQVVSEFVDSETSSNIVSDESTDSNVSEKPDTSSKNQSSTTSKKDENKNIKESVEKVEINKDSPSLTVDDIETTAGKTIKVPFYLNENPGIMTCAIEILYNSDKLTYIGYDEGKVFSNYTFYEKNDSLWFHNLENNDTKKTGVMFYLNFKVKEDAVLGDTEIKINITDESFVNFDEEFVKFKGGNSVVTIK